MTIYEKAKSLVTAREAAEHYGLTVNRYGRCCFVRSSAQSIRCSVSMRSSLPWTER